MDAVQLAWGAIVKGIARLEDPRAFPAWAYRIASRACAGEIGHAVARRRLALAYASEPRVVNVEPEEPSQFGRLQAAIRSEEHTSELQSLMRISYAVFCLKKKKTQQ